MKPFILPFCLTIGTLAASDGVCVRCEEARKYNEEHPNPYVYYEDYLQAKGQEAVPAKEKTEQKK